MASLAPGLYARLFNTLAQAYAAKVESSARVLAYATPFNSAERQTVLASFAAVAHTQGEGGGRRSQRGRGRCLQGGGAAALLRLLGCCCCCSRVPSLDCSAGLPHDTLTKLLGTVGKPHLTVKALQPHMAAALLALAGLAGRPPSSALVVACCGAIKRHLGRARCVRKGCMVRGALGFLDCEPPRHAAEPISAVSCLCSPEALRLAQAGLCRLQSPDCDDARAAVGAQLAQLEAAAS